MIWNKIVEIRAISWKEGKTWLEYDLQHYLYQFSFLLLKDCKRIGHKLFVKICINNMDAEKHLFSFNDSKHCNILREKKDFFHLSSRNIITVKKCMETKLIFSFKLRLLMFAILNKSCNPWLVFIYQLNHFHPLIPDKPICSLDQKKIYGVARGEVVSINCSVSANPGQDLVFRWTFNNTSELANIQDTRFSQNGTVSRLIYSPYHELDYGTILCWAANVLGEQEEPCTYHIIPAGNSTVLCF